MTCYCNIKIFIIHRCNRRYNRAIEISRYRYESNYIVLSTCYTHHFSLFSRDSIYAYQDLESVINRSNTWYIRFITTSTMRMVLQDMLKWLLVSCVLSSTIKMIKIHAYKLNVETCNLHRLHLSNNTRSI